MTSLTRWPSPAKLNLFLHITGRLDNGYHTLQTLFQLLDYGDELTFTVTDNPEILLSPAIDGVPNADNLIVRAARLLQQHCDGQQGADIRLYKKLPMGAGLGGGSSNAATTLVALNHLWQTQLDLAQLAELGLQLGADVPVFVHGHSAWAEGVGEKLTSLDLPEAWFVVVTPNCHVDTGKVFSHPLLTRDTPAIKIAPVLEQEATNNCQSVACKLHPEIQQALDLLGDFGDTKMTGTGASVFSSFSSKEEAESVLQQLPHELRGFVARGINTTRWPK